MTHRASWIFAALLLAVLCVAGYREATLRAPASLGPDQEEYLASGVAAYEEQVFFWKAPLYSLWLAAFYRISGGDAARYARLEKGVSVLLLALMLGALAWRLIDGRTGLLAVFWTLQCKYLLVEPNNSHTLAAILFASSGLCLLTLKPAQRLPAALFALFLAAQVRAEMWLVLGGVIAILFLREGWERLREKRRTTLFAAGSVWWGVGLALALGVWTLFHFRQGSENHYRLLDEAFAQNFAANYVERNGLEAQYPSPWRSCHEIRRTVMPGAEGLVDAIRLHPGIVAAHIRHNVRVSLRAIPASVLGIDRKGLWALVVGLYLVSYLVTWTAPSTTTGWSRLSEEQKWQLGALAGSTIALVLSTWLFRAAARYYIQLIPVLLPALALALHWILGNRMRIHDQRHSSCL
ncbi:MAG: hypothetical protein SF339_10640 [Blastocatellia bacterium]|nr:hypothetical protein [Blastocatellia bacterium]